MRLSVGFDAETNSSAPLTGPATLLSRLHDNGQAFVEQLKAAGPLLLVLDECHHLLEVWGRLLGELLDQLPDAMVLGLTATPPEALTADQAAAGRRAVRRTALPRRASRPSSRSATWRRTSSSPG